MNAVQWNLNLDGVLPTHEQEFREWHAKPGAKHILRDAFRLTASYVPQWKRTGIPVSATLVFELLRHRVKHVMDRAERKAVKEAALDGYTLPNCIRPYMARFIMERRPEWQGVFETREVGVKRRTRKVLVIEEGGRQS